MDTTSSQPTYETPYLAKLVNSLPRFDVSMRRVNSTFLPDSNEYKQVLDSTQSLIKGYTSHVYVENRKFIGL